MEDAVCAKSFSEPTTKNQQSGVAGSKWLKLGTGGDRPYVETRFGMIVDGKGTKGRYVRLYSNGNTSNEMSHYIEVEIFGISG